MPPKATTKASLTQGEKKKIKQDNKAKANPEKAAAKKVKADGKRERRWVIWESLCESIQPFSILTPPPVFVIVINSLQEGIRFS